MVATQNENWALIEQQFAVFERNFHVLRDCDQMLFPNQQLNFNFDTLSSLLSMIHASVKSFRAALFACRINVLNYTCLFAGTPSIVLSTARFATGDIGECSER